MVTPIDFEVLPGLLRGDELRNWLRTDGAGLFTAFDTGVEALSFARDLGLAIRTQDFYEIRRQVLNVAESSQPLLNYPDNQLIPLNFHVQDHGLDLTTEFQYRIHMYGADENTGLLKGQWMTVASDRQLTIDEVKEVARSYVGEGGVSGEIMDFQFAEVEPLRR
jgi:hypothetical protein